MNGINKFKEKVENMYSEFNEETTIESIDYELSSAVKTLFRYTYFKIEDYFIQKGTYDKPVILLSDEIYKGYAYYDKRTKEIVVLAHHFKKALFNFLKKQKLPAVIAKEFYSKLLYSLLHELGHYYYYQNDHSILDSSFKAIHSLVKTAKLMSLNETKNSEFFKEVLLSESFKAVTSERYADDFALKELQTFFPENIPGEKFMQARRNSYKVYAEEKMRSLIQLSCLSLDRNEKRQLKSHYADLIQSELETI